MTSRNQRLYLALLIGGFIILLGLVGYGFHYIGSLDPTDEAIVLPTLESPPVVMPICPTCVPSTAEPILVIVTATPEPTLAIETATPESTPISFSFAITSDMRKYAGPGEKDDPQYFRGAVEALKAQTSTDFMVVNGDMGTLELIEWTLDKYLGSDYRWFPLVGNHEMPGAGIETTPGDLMEELREFDYGDVNPGPSGCPETTYSFDHENAHFVMLNVYCNRRGDTATDGDVPDHLYDWLVSDLDATTQEHIFVFGHEPAYPQPDADSGDERHFDDSLNAHPRNRDRLWDLLEDKEVVFYANGHTHCFSVVEIDGVWQVDSGHATGNGEPGQSTFIIIYVDGGSVEYQAFRDDGEGGPYTLEHSGVLK